MEPEYFIIKETSMMEPKISIKFSFKKSTPL